MRHPSGNPAEHRSTFVPDLWQWASRYVGSPEFGQIPERAILAQKPDRIEYPHARARAKADPDYVLHEDRLQAHQLSHEFRKMNYLRKRASETGSIGDRKKAWKLRQDLAGELFWIIEEILDQLQASSPHADLARASDFALSALYNQIDTFAYSAGVSFSNFARERILHSIQRTTQVREGGQRPLTGAPLEAWEQLPGSEGVEPPAIDQRLVKKFWNLVKEKLEALQNGEIKFPWPGSASQEPLADILYLRYAEGTSLEDIGRLRNVTRERMRQMISKGLRYIREIVLRDPEVQAVLVELGMGVTDNDDVNLLINRVRYKPRTGADKPRRG